MEAEKNNSKNLNALRNKLTSKLHEVNQSPDSNLEETTTLDESQIKPGAIVFVPKFNKNGTVLSYPNQSKKFNIQIDNIKTTLTPSQITIAKNTETKKEIITKKQSMFAPKNVKTELNVIGMNIEESIFLVDKFLDEAAVAKLETVRIVHGKGTGILGKGIQKYLRSHPHVKSYRYGIFGEGEMGVTVVEIK